MPAVKPCRLRPLLHLSLLLSLGASPPFVTSSWADSSPKRSYQVPAGPLSAALTRFAGLAGVDLSLDPALVNGRTSPGLSGEYAVEEGFARLLQGSGLQLAPVGAQAYTVMPAPEQSAALQIPVTSITGTATNSGSADTVYAGGQVARAGGLGMLGQRDYMDTPFSQTSYTSTQVKNQQARTLGDMVAADPTVRTTNPAGGRFEQFSIRGLSLFNSDVSYSGLYGVLPTYAIDMEMVERVDILRGPAALLGGIAPRGSVGGGINIEPKRATDAPITEVTGSYASKGQFGSAIDIGRRFGEDQRFGVRFNGVRQSGDTEWDHQSVEREMAAVGFDLRDERVRLSLDLGRQERHADAPQERVELARGATVPKAEDIKHNFANSWTYAHSKDTFGALRGEFDLSDTLMLYAAAGARSGDYDFFRHGVQNTASNGNFTVQPRLFQRTEDVKTAMVGLRKRFDTGPVGHEVNLSATYFSFDFDNSGTRYANSISNLYNPVDRPEPTGAPTRTDDSTHTENLFTSVALADTLSLAEDRVLLTLGARLQRVQVDNWTNGARDAAEDEQKVSPAVGIVYKLTDEVSLYSNYMEGLTQGQTAPTTAINANEIFPPFTSKQLEAGVKYDRGTLGMTASVFRIEQTAYATSNNTFEPNGELRNQGLELSAFGEPLDGVRLLGGVMVLDSEVVKSGTGANDFKGNRGTGSPVLNVNLGAEWDIPTVEGLTLNARAIHTGSQYVDAANRQKIDNWERYDVGARYAFKVEGRPITLRATVENVLDKTYFSSAASSSDSAPGLTLSTPRTYLVSATVGF
ncbi:TonB-dependent siderophore receptor [Pseudomonas sp. nanlin1]|uniref:TonB-dependent siderophore receptor n=1 Tax=Pseudomonas sp. nanlin1 TaxID=3040605 RepID=UPI00388E6D7C